ncbi:hypothetical protein M8C21_006203, partial [Ambrosia artemisiifolia]
TSISGSPPKNLPFQGPLVQYSTDPFHLSAYRFVFWTISKEKTPAAGSSLFLQDLEVLPGLKKPSSKFPPLDMIVWFPVKDWFADMVSAPDERGGIMRKKHKISKHSIKL